MTDIEIAKGSVEYLLVDVEADITLDNQVVEFAIAPVLTATPTWLTGQWIGAAGLARTCRVLLDGNLAVGKYGVFVRITTTPEIPIIKAGVLRVKAN